jgi:hypothetical protein
MEYLQRTLRKAWGVQEEIEIGLDLAKELKDPRFVIPLRIRPYKKLFGIGGAGTGANVSCWFVGSRMEGARLALEKHFAVQVMQRGLNDEKFS